jgi:hypothetical protein
MKLFSFNASAVYRDMLALAFCFHGGKCVLRISFAKLGTLTVGHEHTHTHTHARAGHAPIDMDHANVLVNSIRGCVIEVTKADKLIATQVTRSISFLGFCSVIGCAIRYRNVAPLPRPRNNACSGFFCRN